MSEFRETTTKSWGDRLGGALTGVVVGLVVFVISFPLLWWNEGRSVDRAKTLEEGLGLVVPVAADTLDPANEKGLVHISDVAKGDAPLTDALFGVSTDALKLKRIVEMYQWIETAEKKTVKDVGGTERTETTYRYHMGWHGGVVNSGQFRIVEGHENPGSLPVDDSALIANKITMGAFALTRDFLTQIVGDQTLTVSQAMYDRATRDIRDAFALAAGKFHIGNPAAPRVGDIRVSFQQVPSQEIGVVGRQSGGRIETYQAKNGEIALLRMGGGSAQAMFSDAEDDNLILTWVLRGLGFIAMWGGLAMLFGPIKVVADFLPFLGSLVGAGIGMVTGLVAFALSFITIGSAWIVYRPLVGLSLLAIAAIVAAGGTYLMRYRKKAVEQS